MTEPGLPARATPVRPGDPARIGAYEIVGFLGEGGMGVVYLGRGQGGDLVAIKVVRAEFARHPEFRARFRREAESAMRVPRFCTAEVLLTDPDVAEPYLVTEYIDGPTLDEVVRTGGPLHRAELDQLAVSMAAALTGIHAAGVTHRDLKPANVLLSRMGPRVIDFGIANAVDAVQLTVAGQMLGTPAYMAPEQADGRAGPASDVFAWGGVMVFAATGRSPFGTGPLRELAARIMHGEPDLSGIAEPMRSFIEAALNKDESHRPTPGRLLELMGVAGTDPAAAVQTRLAGLGLPDPATPPSAALTRHDPQGRGTAHAAGGGTGAGTSPGTGTGTQPGAGVGAATAEDGVSLRFGPGVGAGPTRPPDEATRIWRSGKRPAKRSAWRRARSLTSAVLGLALFAGAAAWLILQNQSGELRVTKVTVAAAKERRTCGNVNLTGTVTTNGSPGRLTYQWKLSDKKDPEAAVQVTVEKGAESVTLPFRWQFQGRARKALFSATLTVAGPGEPGQTADTSFTYTCVG